MKSFIPVLFAILLAACSWILVRAPYATSTSQDRLQLSTGWADESSCIQCHTEAKTFSKTGHARTMHTAGHSDLQPLIQLMRETPAFSQDGLSIESRGSDLRVQRRDGESFNDVTLNWCLGSGDHARTWIGTLHDSDGTTNLLEFRWTWYRELQEFGVTPGQPDEPGQGYYSHLGVLFDHPKARRCLGCHSTRLPIDAGQIQEHQIQAGVNCQRCHGPRQSHVASDGEIREQFWSSASRDEQVARCAECHRHPDEQDPRTVRRDNPDIVRFQPIGLAQSACFQKSQMTCTTCHDPHRSLAEQQSKSIGQCLQCHDGATADRPGCGLGKTEDCLSCHMPKVKMDRPVHFTDHWIRVRDEANSP